MALPLPTANYSYQKNGFGTKMDLESIERELIEFDRLNAIAREKKAGNDKIENLFRKKVIKMEDLKGVEETTMANARNEVIDLAKLNNELPPHSSLQKETTLTELRHQLWIADQLFDFELFMKLVFENKEYTVDAVLTAIAYSKVAGDCLITNDQLEPSKMNWVFPLQNLPTLSGFNKFMFEEYRFDPTPNSKQTVTVPRKDRIENILIREAKGMHFWNIFDPAHYDFTLQNRTMTTMEAHRRLTLFYSTINSHFINIFRAHKLTAEDKLKNPSEKERLKFFREVISNLNDKLVILDEVTVKQELEELKDHYHYIITSKMDDIVAKRRILIEKCKKLDFKLQLYAVKDIHKLTENMLLGYSLIKSIDKQMIEQEEHLKYYLQELNPSEEVTRIMVNYKQSFDRMIESYVK
jgi:hypothetical protein